MSFFVNKNEQRKNTMICNFVFTKPNHSQLTKRIKRNTDADDDDLFNERTNLWKITTNTSRPENKNINYFTTRTVQKQTHKQIDVFLWRIQFLQLSTN